MTPMKLFVLLFAAALIAPAAVAAQRPDAPTAGPAVVKQPAAPAPAPTPEPVLAPTPAPVVAAPERAQPDPVEACCNITAIAGANVTARDPATGATFQFQVTDRAVLRSLAVGTPVWADFATGRAGLTPGEDCCDFVGSPNAEVDASTPKLATPQPAAAQPDPQPQATAMAATAQPATPQAQSPNAEVDASTPKLATPRPAAEQPSVAAAQVPAAAVPSPRAPAAAAAPVPRTPVAAAVPTSRPPAPAVASAPVPGARSAGAANAPSVNAPAANLPPAPTSTLDAVAGSAPLAANLITPTDLMGSVTVESPVHGGWEAEMTVTLSKPAPETNNPDRHCRGVHVLTESSHPEIAPVGVSICIQPGQTTKSVMIRTTGVATDTPVTVSARYLDFPARTATLDVLAPAVDRIEMAATTAAGGDTLDAILHFTGPPPASPPIKAYLESTDPAVATVPATLTLPLNATTVPFKIPIHPVGEDTELRIRASRNPLPSAPPQSAGDGGGITGALAAAQQVAIITTDIKSVTIEVLPAELKMTSWVTLYLPPTSTTVWAASSSVSAELDGQAPKGGAVVQLSSERPDLVSVPASITIPEGSWRASAVVEVGTPSGDQASVKVTGTYRGVTRSSDFTVQKHDFTVLPAIVFTDPYGNPVTTPQDSQPLTMCAKIGLCGSDPQNPDCGTTPLPPTVVLHYDYMSYHPTTQTSTGRSGDLTLGIDTYIPVCMEVGGVDEGGWLEVDLLVDPANLIPERSETNNDRSIKITRP